MQKITVPLLKPNKSNNNWVMMSILKFWKKLTITRRLFNI